MNDSELDSLVDMVVVDTDVMSYVFKHDTRAALYEPHLAGKDLIISFVHSRNCNVGPSQATGALQSGTSLRSIEHGLCLSL